MVGKLEDALKSAGSDALIEHLAVLFFLDLLGALDRERIFFHLDRKLVFAEAGNRDGYSVIVLTRALDIVGRVARSRLETVQHGKQTVEADGGTIKGEQDRKFAWHILHC